MKSEPKELSIDDALQIGAAPWFGVRNYQARNFMRDQMQVGDGVLFYHSSCAEPGIAGIAGRTPRADRGARSKATLENPRWILVDVKATHKTRLLSLTEMRTHAALASMVVLQKGSRLSITPVAPMEWATVLELLAAK